MKSISGLLSRVFLVICLLGLMPIMVFSQSHNYWTRSFNEESSLLGGAVVGGGAGPSAIYFNPSSISEITESKFSLHASLFQFDFVNVKNALGEEVDINSLKVSIAPRFLSYMIQPKKHPEWSFEIAFLNNENYRMEFTENVDFVTNVLTNLPGDERYFATAQYSNNYRDDWIGFGGSWKVNPHWYVGASLFVSVQSLEYNNSLDIETFPISDSIVVGGEYIPFYSANYQSLEYVKYNDYRLLAKFGTMYSHEKISFGVALTTPSIGVYSDGKKVTRKLKQSNITSPETGEELPDYVIVDFQEKKNVSVDAKRPLAFAAGFNYTFSEKNGTLFTTVEYFNGIDAYRIVEANENPTLAAGSVFENLDFNEWLTFVSGAQPVLNVALGYRTILKDNLMLMAGFRTDFNYRKDVDYMPYIEYKKIESLDVDLYHITSGLTLTLFGQDLIAGLQYSVGRQRNVKQFRNLTDPLEFNSDENAALQGTRQSNMNSFVNSLSLYFGATFNFGGDQDK